jgi:hypothetical protein
LSCHALGNLEPKEKKGPDLTGYRSKAWIRQALRDPDSLRLFGHTKVYGMEPYAAIPAADLDALAGYVYSLRDSPKTPEEAGVDKLIETHECTKCHDFEDDYGLEGPALFRYGSATWVRAAIADPGADHLYGKANTMPKFSERLSAEDLDALTAFVMTLEERGGAADRWPYADEPAPTARVKPTDTATAAAP